MIELLIKELSLGPATLRRVLTGREPTRVVEEPPKPGTESRKSPPVAVEASAAELAPEATAAAAGAELLDVDICLDEEAAAEAPDADNGDRRGRRRAAYSQTVPAFGKRALRVLVGRDLSIGGMRIEPLPGLEIGDRLHLAIYGDPGESPFLVWATVVRDDGESGKALSFDPLERTIGERLERLVGGLPAVESLHDTEAQAMGTVVSEILPD